MLSNCTLVNFVTEYALIFGKLFSSIGSSFAFCCQKFACDVNSLLCNRSALFRFKKHLSGCSADIAHKASFLIELLMVRDGLLSVPNFTRDNVQCIINSLCSD